MGIGGEYLGQFEGGLKHGKGKLVMEGKKFVNNGRSYVLEGLYTLTGFF